MTERLREEQDQGDEQNDNRACGHVGRAGLERDEGGHLYEHHNDRNLKESDRRRVNGCADFAWIIDVVNIITVHKVFDGHEEETCVGRVCERVRFNKNSCSPNNRKVSKRNDDERAIDWRPEWANDAALNYAKHNAYFHGRSQTMREKGKFVAYARRANR